MIDYTYDAMGQRVVKKVTTHYNPGGSENSKTVKKTIYARDANGQVMAIYNTAFAELFNTTKNDDFIRKLCFWVTFELSPGVTKTIKLCEGESFQFADPTEILVSLAPQPLVVSFDNSPAQGGGVTNITLLPNTLITLDFDPLNYLKIGGDKSLWGWYWNTKTGKYEKRTLNKINIFVDKKTKIVVGQNSNGSPAQVKIIQVTCEYNYENVLTAPDENNIPELAEWHVYGNEQQGRFLTVYPTRQYVNTNPDLTQRVFYGAGLSEDITNNIFKRQLGNKSYELKDHLGNVRVTFSDIKIPTAPYTTPFQVDLLSKSEYFPYGMQIEELGWNAVGASARYGYNGTHEQDLELNADGNYLDFGNFGYDTRVAMRRNQEPLIAKYPNLSGYSAFGSNPIFYKDPDGNWVKGSDGKPMSYNILFGHIIWSKNTTEDTKRIGKAMLRNEIGKTAFDSKINSNYPVTYQISKDLIYNEDGLVKLGNNNVVPKIDGEIELNTIKIYENGLLEYCSDLLKDNFGNTEYQGMLYKEIFENGDFEAAIGAIGTHESTHGSKENLNSYKENKHEVMPEQKETEYLKKELEKK